MLNAGSGKGGEFVSYEALACHNVRDGRLMYELEWKEARRGLGAQLGFQPATRGVCSSGPGQLS